MKATILLFGSLILATILGVFSQDIAYFLNDYIAEIAPIYYLTALTATSIVLYLGTPVLTYIFTKKQHIDKAKFGPYLFTITILGIPISLWSLFVLAMWWG